MDIIATSYLSPAQVTDLRALSKTADRVARILGGLRAIGGALPDDLDVFGTRLWASSDEPGECHAYACTSLLGVESIVVLSGNGRGGGHRLHLRPDHAAGPLGRDRLTGWENISRYVKSSMLPPVSADDLSPEDLVGVERAEAIRAAMEPAVSLLLDELLGDPLFSTVYEYGTCSSDGTLYVCSSDFRTTIIGTDRVVAVR